MITLAIRYTVDHNKLVDFEAYVRALPAHIERCGGKCVGYVTSGGYAHYTKESVALGYVPAALAASDDEFQIEILGDMRTARIQPRALYDPNGGRMKS